MDNLKDENGNDILGLIQESYSPIGLHVDAGFDAKKMAKSQRKTKNKKSQKK